MLEYIKKGGRRLLVGYTDVRAKKDAYNHDKGIRRFEKAYRVGRLTKENFNKRSYNSLLKLSHINMIVDRVLAMAQTVTTIEIKLPLNKDVIRKTMGIALMFVVV